MSSLGPHSYSSDTNGFDALLNNVDDMVMKTGVLRNSGWKVNAGLEILGAGGITWHCGPTARDYHCRTAG